MRSRRKNRCWGALLVAGIMWMVPAVAHAAGDPARGKSIAERWCTTCHVVAPSGRGSDTAPNFGAIARARDDTYIRSFLTTPHPPMPQFELSRQNIEDLATYFATLRQ